MYPGRHVAAAPDKAAVVMAGSGDRVTYRQLEDRSVQLARLLRSRGLVSGDGVCILAENHVRYFEVYWAAMRSGLYLTAVNRHLGPEEAAYIVRDCGAKALITTTAMGDVAARLASLVPDCEHRFVMDGLLDGYEPYEPAIATQCTEPPASQPLGEVMLYSSGSTGRPKGIKRPLRSVEIGDPSVVGVSGAERALFGMDHDSVYLCPAPLYHSAAIQWSAGVHELGATLVVMERFDAEGFLSVIEREQVTHTQVVPTMLVRVLKLPAEIRDRYDLSSLQCVVHAAAPCPVEVKQQLIDWLGPIVVEFYGGTEGVGMTFITSPEWLEHRGSVGKSMLGTIHVCDEAGAELPAGETGLVYFEQPTMTFEYHGDDAKTRQSRHPDHDNWATLGDIGYVDTDGYLYLTDRAAFLIISGGVNIYPAEIESCLIMHPAVADVAVFGLPHDEMGEYVHAVVQLVPGYPASDELAEDIKRYAQGQLARFKVPRSVDFRDELPRMPTGKLFIKGLRQEYLDAKR